MIKEGRLDNIVNYIIISGFNQAVRVFLPWLNGLLRKVGTKSMVDWANSTWRLSDYSQAIYREWLGKAPQDRHSKT